MAVSISRDFVHEIIVLNSVNKVIQLLGNRTGQFCFYNFQLLLLTIECIRGNLHVTSYLVGSGRW